jgi:hypothetical protein
MTTTITPTTMPVSEHLYDMHLQLLKIGDYGVNIAELNNGTVQPPLEGTRVDMTFEGVIEGAKVRGTIQGHDYVLIRADGRRELNIWAEVTTNDGARMALIGTGLALPDQDDPALVQIRETAKLTTHDPRYAWVNHVQVWITGTVDMNTGRLLLHAYAA